VVDLSGALAGNLQLRAFPACAILAAPVTATWLLERAPRPGQAARLARAGLWLALGLLLVFSTWKAANDPLVSNKWVFYEAAEARAIEWADGHLAENGLLWVSFDERLITRPDEASGAGERRIRLDVAAPDPGRPRPPHQQPHPGSSEPPRSAPAGRGRQPDHLRQRSGPDLPPQAA
jgi:hypothetical protein